LLDERVFVKTVLALALHRVESQARGSAVQVAGGSLVAPAHVHAPLIPQGVFAAAFVAFLRPLDGVFVLSANAQFGDMFLFSALAVVVGVQDTFLRTVKTEATSLHLAFAQFPVPEFVETTGFGLLALAVFMGLAAAVDAVPGLPVVTRTEERTSALAHLLIPHVVRSIASLFSIALTDTIAVVEHEELHN
jgi:hypothetical protein